MFIPLFTLIVLWSAFESSHGIEIVQEGSLTVISFRNVTCRPKSREELAAQLGLKVHPDYLLPDMEPYMFWNVRGVQGQPTRLRRHASQANSQPYNDSMNEEESDLQEPGAELIYSQEQTAPLYRPLDNSSLRKRKRHIVRSLPWECNMMTQWMVAAEGVFPKYLLAGQCVRDTCFGFYKCIPQKYLMSVLKRDPSVCRPVPVEGSETIYEEHWEYTGIEVTVACICGTP